MNQYSSRECADLIANAVQRGENICPLIEQCKLSIPSTIFSWIIHIAGMDLETQQKKNDAILQTEIDVYRHTLIHLAIQRKHYRAFTEILSLNTTLCLPQKNIMNENLLHCCIWNQNFKVFQYLCQQSSTQALMNQADIFGLEPLTVLYLHDHLFVKWQKLIQKQLLPKQHIPLKFPSPAEQLLILMFRSYLLKTDNYKAIWTQTVVPGNYTMLYKGQVRFKSVATDEVVSVSLMSFVAMTGDVELLQRIQWDDTIDTILLFQQVCAGMTIRRKDTMLIAFGFRFRDNWIQSLLDSNLVLNLIQHTPRNLWYRLLYTAAVAHEMELLNYLVAFGIHPDNPAGLSPNKLNKSLAPHPSEEIHVNLNDRHAVSLLFRAGSDWLPERYQDPRNFFSKLLSKEPQHLWWQFVDDFQIQLQPSDMRWKTVETKLLRQYLTQMNSAKPKSMRGGECMICSEEVNNTLCGPAGCSCALCAACCQDFTKNMYMNWGNEVVKCAACKGILHFTFLQQLYSAKYWTEEQFRTVCRRQYKNYWLQQNPDWRYCSDECIGGKAIALNSASNFLQCNFCWKRVCYKCGGKHAQCDDAKQDLVEFKRLLQEGRKIGGMNRPCPNDKCGELIYREFGCNAVVCYKCGIEFHWNYGPAANIPKAMKLCWAAYCQKYNKLIPHDSDDMTRQYETIHDSK